MTTSHLREPRVVSRDEWRQARQDLLRKEKELTRQIDAVNAARRALPWVRVEKEYLFQTPDGRKTLRDLFAGRSQLIIYHFMFGPGWKEGCDGCSFLADHFDGVNLHLAHHDVTLLAVSRAPLEEFLPFKKRMGWRFEWVSSNPSDFNRDFDVTHTKADILEGNAFYNYERLEDPEDAGESHGISVFCKDAAGGIYHTYSSYARGGDLLIGVHNFLDLTPKGRNEGSTMDWVRLHDLYEGENG